MKKRDKMLERKFAKIVVEEKIDGIATTIRGDEQRVEALMLELVKSIYARNPLILKNLLAKMAKIGVAKGVLGLVSKAISGPED